MSFTLASCLTLALLGGDALEIANVHGTHGRHGPKRSSPQGVLPGDQVHYRFDIKNLKKDEKGKGLYSVAVEVRDAKGDVLFRQEPHNAIAQNFFGGNSVSCTSYFEIPATAKPGEVNWRIAVEDRISGAKTELKGQGKIRESNFGLVRAGLFGDPEGSVAVPSIGRVGNEVYVRFATVGHAVDPKSKQPDIKVALRILDESQKPTMAAPLLGRIHEDIPESLQLIPVQFALALDRPGRYTLELTARDELGGKTDTLVLPIRILEAD